MSAVARRADMPVLCSERFPRVAVLGVAFVNFLIHLLIYDHLGFHRDELLYLALGHHPAAGYQSVPPFIGLLAAGLHGTVGASLFSVKFLAALMAIPTTLVATATARELGGRRFAMILTAVTLLYLPAFQRMFHLFQPVVFDVFWWSTLAWLFLRWQRTGRTRDLYLLGVVVGAALLTKYLVLLSVFGLLIGLLIEQHIRPFQNKHLYGAAGIALLVVLPNLIWQIAYDFPVIDHLSELQEQQLVNVSRGRFLLDQLMMGGIGSLVLVPGLWQLFREETGRILAWQIVVVLLILLLLRGKSYYTLGVFTTLLAAGSVWWERVLTRKAARTIFAASLLVLSVPLLPLGMPVFRAERMIAYFEKLEQNYGLTPGRTWESGNLHALPQDYADQLAWPEIAALVKTAYQKYPGPTTLVYAENYGQAGAVLQFTDRKEVPHPVSFSDAFRYWNPRRFEPEIETLIYVNDEMGQDVIDLFEEIEVIGRVENVYAREVGTTVYVCRRPRSSFNYFWAAIYDRLEISR